MRKIKLLNVDGEFTTREIVVNEKAVSIHIPAIIAGESKILEYSKIAEKEGYEIWGTNTEERARYSELKFQYEALHNAFSNLQKVCKHKNTLTTYDSDTGNYDRSQDKYWIEYKCYDCGKYWETPQ